jgi:hypothetical protein
VEARVKQNKTQHKTGHESKRGITRELKEKEKKGKGDKKLIE